MSEDAIAKFKEAQRQGWKHFAPLEALTTPAAARLVKFANVRAGQNVLDVGCGTGVAAISAARIGARVRGIDLTPELLIGSSFKLVASYMPPPPPGVSSSPQWGDVAIVRERLGSAVKDIVFDRACMLFPALSVQNYRDHIERNAGPMLKLVESLLTSDPARLAQFRGEYDALIAPYFEDNVVRQDYLLTRAVKM